MTRIPQPRSPRIGWPTMHAWGVELLVAAGLADSSASCVVESLEYAERRGFASHGYMRLPTYAERIQAGGINQRPGFEILSDTPVVAIVDADAAPGAVSASTCTDMALAKARVSGFGLVIARGANHFGAAGYYTDRIAAAGFLGIALCNTDAVMCAPFGGRPVLGTNPISIAVPTSDGVGPQLDMATSEASYGKIAVARNRGEPIPAGWAVDADGVSTNDPAAGLAGALLPSGGPKGFGLSFMVDALVAIGGAETSDQVSALYGDPASPQGLGHVFIAIAVDQVQSLADYSARIAGLTSAVHASGTPGSARPPMVPGEPERQRLQDAASWLVDESTLDQLAALSREMGVAVPPEAAGDRRVGVAE